MIEEKISLHGKHQFEIKQYYSLLSGRRNKSFYVKTYIFIPNNLNVNRSSYNKEDFYSDLHTYIRLRTPTLYLEDLVGSSRIFKRLEARVETLIHDPSEENFTRYEDAIKIFCLVLKKSLRLQLLSISESSSSRERSRFIKEYVRDIREMLFRFRKLEKRVLLSDDKEVLSLYQLADEYVSLKAESHTFKLLEIMRGDRKGLSYKGKLLDLISEETKYRQEREYPAVVAKEGNNANFIFRQGVLKKYISNVLFLETRIEKSGKYLEQVLYSLAAGVAMIFATAVAFIGQNKYGNLSTPFFIALVISYMFKDRIKEILRIYFNQGLSKWFFDRKKQIFHNFKNKMGVCKESFNYIKESKVPKEIMRIRKRDRFTNIDNSLVGEDIILYRKYIKLNSKGFQRIKEKYESEGIIDIVRFNIEKFLRYMDDPGKKIYLAEKGDYVVMEGERVYHMNLITHYTVDGIDYYNKFRVVFNRKGIKKIKEIMQGCPTENVTSA